ncbi:hypothetical protein GSI_02007 [Ganoderma sinense ZZ0214-1]|uniref:DUF6533 domain-containing protein n=1 Tax=Ganoderma sinense ZZ0214-1 TaxID=1077348 RepID=A0A2G8SNE2_9APHY|nr:hypothetical protein GSI_02007 [Ganoderma sinense ZZ0214-1]
MEEGDVVASFGPRWAPLRRLVLASPNMAVCVVDRLSAVRLLQVSGMLGFDDTPEDGHPVFQFLELLRVASPIGLYASLRIERGGFSGPFWKDVRACAPRLRSLELKLSYSAVRGNGDGDDWLNPIRMADESDSAAVIAALNAVLAGDYMDVTTMVVVVYDYLITFGVEVDLFWRKEITGASIVFFLNRYLILAYNLIRLPTWFPLSGSTL